LLNRPIPPAGTDKTMPPEVRQVQVPDVIDPEKVDIYALGVELFCLLTHKSIWPHWEWFHAVEPTEGTAYVIQALVELSIAGTPIAVNEHARKLLSGLLASDPAQRWTLDQVRVSQWLSLPLAQ